MAKYLDEAGLSTLWGKIKDTFVAKTIKKSDSSNATQITHNGDTVSLSRGTIYNSASQPGSTTYSKKTSIDIIGDDIIFTANHRPMYKTGSGEDPKNLVISNDIATSSTAGLVKSSTTGKTSNRDYMVEVNLDGTMKVNVPWTDTNTTYSAGTGLSLSGTTFSVKTGYSESGKNYAVKTDTNGNLYVNVPWVNTTDHSHSNKTILDQITEPFTTALKTDISNLKTQIGGLTGAMHFKGAVSSLPTNLTSYNAGDVVLFGNKEYVLNDNSGTKSWIELGDEGSHLTKTEAANTYATKNDLSSVAQNASAKIDKSILTTKGDIIYASAANTPTRLGIGANGKILKVVNEIPVWSDDNNTTYTAGTGLSLSGTTFNINTGYTTSGKNYAVKTDSNKNLYVNVPWTDTNTTYSAGNGISLNGTTFSLNTNYENNGRNYAVLVDTNKNLYVNVPWVNTTDHSHSNKTILDNFEGAIPTNYIENLS